MMACYLLLIGGVCVVLGLGLVLKGVEARYRHDEQDAQAGIVDQRDDL